MSALLAALGLSWGLLLVLGLIALALFWAVGARQRLAALRQRIDQSFEPIQAQM